MGRTKPEKPSTLTSLPLDELVVYARELGLAVDSTSPRGELLRLIRRRQELLLEIERDVLLDIVVWARRPVRKSSSKEALAKEIAAITRNRFDGLSDRGLRAMARLRGLLARDHEPREVIERRLRRQEGFFSRIRRKRRAVVGTVLGKLLEGPGEPGEYRFLPEDEGHGSLQESISDAGVVGGIAQKLRGAADHYIDAKLDEIERRIDAKLDEIDRRLAEWRDQEVHNRLRIIKFTLVSAIVVAIISLSYDSLKQGRSPTTEEGRSVSPIEDAGNAG